MPMAEKPALAIMIGHKGKRPDDDDSGKDMYAEMASDMIEAVEKKDSSLLAKILEAIATAKG